jgi:hypothetical protein
MGLEINGAEKTAMGIVYYSEKCTHCEYESGQLIHGTGFSFIFVGFATCRTCARVINVYPDTSTIHQDDWLGDYQAHLTTRDTEGIEFNTCRYCGGHDLIHHHLVEAYSLSRQEGKISERETFHLPCPRCTTGKIAFVGAGLWD